MASIKSFTYSASPSFHNEKEVIPIEIARSLDAILVLGGGVPSTISTPPAYVKTRCDAAAKVALSVLSQSKSSGDEERAGNMMPAILCLSAGTAHLPQLLSIDGLPVWESTASAAYILDKYPRIPASKVFAETTSYWIFAAKNSAIRDSTDQYTLHFLSCSNDGLSTEALLARKEHEERGTKTIKDVLSQRYVTLQDVWTFLTTEHDFYSAVKLVKKGREISSFQSKNSDALKNSYGAVS